MRIKFIVVGQVALVALLFFFVFKVYNSEDYSDVSMGRIEAAMSAEQSTKTLETKGDRDLVSAFGIDPTTIDSYMYESVADPMQADELLIVKMKDDTQYDTINDLLMKRIENRTEVFDGYAPEQVLKLDQAIIEKKGKYVLYAVGTDAARWQEAFDGI